MARIKGAMMTVSYTHLDVYKRQGTGRACAQGKGSGAL